MRFALWIGTEQPWAEVVKTVRVAETVGFDAIYLADHFMPADDPPGAEPRLEAWTALAAISALTERVRLGVLVTGNTYRHPAVLAKMAATSDVISNGRLVLGLGAGWQLSEHAAYGIELPEIGERLARLEEACEVVRLLLSQPRSTYEGHYYRLVDAPSEPKPVQARLPLLVGVSGERRALGIAARHADIWNCWGTPEVISHKSAVLALHAEKAGRDPASIERSAQVAVLMSDDRSRLEAWRASADPRRSAAGTAGELSSVLSAYAEIGLDEFVLLDRTLGAEPSERRETMVAFLEEVATAFRGS